MNPEPLHHRRIAGMAMPAAVLCLASWHALPSLLAAWENDLYSKGALLAFVLWLAFMGWLVFKQFKQPPAAPSTAWMLIALVLCAAGAMGSLRVLHHLALAAAVAAFCPGIVRGLIAVLAAFAWLPASGWFLSQLKIGGLHSWERPLATLAILMPLLLASRWPRSSTHQPKS